MSAREPTAPPAASLRRAFDETFAAPPRPERDPLVPLLAVRVGGEPMAVRVLELGGIVRARRIVAVPSRRPELLGISGLRGVVLSIYGLTRLLGRDADDEPRWIAVAAGDDRIGLAFGTLEGHLLVAAQALTPVAPGDGARPHVRELLRDDRGARAVLSVPSLVRTIAGT